MLTIWPGDTVRTKTVDAAGVDERGRTRVLGGNPQTGPFFVEGAMPGDILVVRIKKLRLNRATAISDDGLVERALTADYVSEHKDNKFNDVVWNLDGEKGLATLAKPTSRLKNLAVPVRPMLGCVGVAPGYGSPPIRTGDSGRVGGNMDFNEIREGATLIRGADDLIRDLKLGDGRSGAHVRLDLNLAEQAALELVGGPVLPETVARGLGVSVPEVLPLLLALELKGMIRSVGGRFEPRLKAAAT